MQISDHFREKLNHVKLLATDIDGTLLHSDSTLSDRTKGLLEAAKSRGITLALATGRPYTALPQALQGIDLFQYAITCNGTSIIDQNSGKVILRSTIEPAMVQELSELFRQYPFPLEVVIEGRSHVPAAYYENPLKYSLPERMKDYVRRTRIPVPDIYALIEQHVNEIESLNLIIDKPEVKMQLMTQLQSMSGIYVTSSSPYYLECNPEDAHKGNALRALCQYLKIDASHSIAFGDSENDIDLLKAAGISIAMGNACQSLKDLADLITEANDKEGLAIIMEEMEQLIDHTYRYHIEDDGIIIDGLTESAKDEAYLVIPETINGLEVREIAERAFYEHRGLKGVTLPAKVRKIHKYAFAECRSLEHVMIPDGIEMMGDYAFYNCHVLKMVSLPGHMKNMGYGTFKNCSQMEEVTILTNEKDELEVGALFEDTSHEIHINICDFNHNILTKLILTAFDYDCILQVEARQFDWVYHGSGNVFRQCISKKGIDYKQYDSIFHMAVREDSLETAIQIASDRIIYPHKLLQEHKDKYLAFLIEKKADVYKYYLKNQRIEEFEVLMAYICDGEIIDQWIDLAREKGAMNFVSFLMDYRNRHYGIKKKSFDL